MERASFEVVNGSNVDHIKLINEILFPISYQDSFYRECTAFPDVTQLAYVGSDVAGAIACRVESHQGGEIARLYIMTVGVLEPYRRLGIGSELVRRAVNACVGDTFIKDAYLHVQVDKEQVIHFYKQLGFREQGVVENYYKQLQPPDAMVLSIQIPHHLATAAP